MPSIELLRELQDLYLADDLPIEDGMVGWSRQEAETFFESGGMLRPGVEPAAAPASAMVPSAADDTALSETAIPTPPPDPPTPAAPQPAQALGVFRWLVDISAWQPTDAEWRLLLSTIPEEDATKVMKFHFVDDRKRALVSRLLQRRACFEATGVKYSDAHILRTKGGKPFMANKPTGGWPSRTAHDGDGAAGVRSTWRLDVSSRPPQVRRTPPPRVGDASHSCQGQSVTSHTLTAPRRQAPNWNFNVSHEGQYVALASEPVMVCGVDVAAPEVMRPGRKKRSVDETLRMMDGQLTAAEMKTIEEARPDERRMEDLFRRFWSLKEAYTKGRGDGLGFEFSRCEFTLGRTEDGIDGQPVQLATVRVDGREQPRWRFFIQELEANHWISVGRGPPTDVVDAFGRFKAQLTENVDDARSAAELSRPEPAFVIKRIDELLADEMADEYARVIRDGGARRVS